jgi:hypothetical protein
MQIKYSLFILMTFWIISCNENNSTHLVQENEKNEATTVKVNKHLHDSILSLYDSISNLWMNNTIALGKLESLRLNKNFNPDDAFYLELESRGQYAFELPKKLHDLEDFCMALGIFTFNNRRYLSADEAIKTIDKVLSENKKITDLQKLEINKDRIRLRKMAEIKYVLIE